MMYSLCTTVFLHAWLVVILVLRSYQAVKFPAYRVCKPGPLLGYPSKNSTLKNCLVIGDSVSIGYTHYVKEMLSDVCQVQHAPWDVRDGGALDTNYGLQCLSMFLSTAKGMSTYYDAIVFNFGLHDVHYCPSEFHEEYVGYAEYMNNIGSIYTSLCENGVNLAFISTTPIPYNTTLNDRVKKYNAGVRSVFNTSTMGFLDLYEKVVKVCGKPPFKNCSIMVEQPNVHYQPQGYSYLAKYVSQMFLELLKKSQNPKERSKEKQLQREPKDQGWNVCPKDKFITKQEIERNFIELPKHVKKSTCSPKNVISNYQLDKITACPPGLTCCKSRFSNTGIGCCAMPAATTCSNGLHCCPKEMTCMPDCKDPNSGVCHCKA